MAKPADQKAAKAAYDKVYSEKNKEKKRKRNKKDYQQNPEYRRNAKLKNKFGITLSDYNDMFAAQNGCCKICGKHQQEFKKALCLDHCHTTGNIRALLCNNCNTMLGMAAENKETLLNAIKYLEEYNGTAR